MHVLTIYRVKLMQSIPLEPQHFDLRWVLPPLYNLRLLLELEIRESQNLARLRGQPTLKALGTGWERNGVHCLSGESSFSTGSDIGG